MTTVYVDPVLAASMLALGKLVSPGPGQWSASSPEQEEFLGKLGALTETIAMLPDFFFYAAAKSAGPVNAFLARHGFAGNLREAGPQSLYAAAVLDLLVEWVTPGSAVQLALHDGRLAPGVRLKKGHFRVDGRVLSPEVKPGPIYVRMCESVTLDEGLAIIAGTIYVAPNGDYGAAAFPMVSLDVDVDASKMIGLRNGDWTVDQAFARAKLRLDPKGAHAQAAAAMAATRGIVKTFKIAGPFTIAFVTGDGQVAIAYHVTEEHFSAPA